MKQKGHSITNAKISAPPSEYQHIYFDSFQTAFLLKPCFIRLLYFHEVLFCVVILFNATIIRFLGTASTSLKYNVDVIKFSGSFGLLGPNIICEHRLPIIALLEAGCMRTFCRFPILLTINSRLIFCYLLLFSVFPKDLYNATVLMFDLLTCVNVVSFIVLRALY